ncbi:hypothetical protein FNV65_46110 [Streptomyces sp. S1A1-8]|uniref:S8 family serine peptidase n=1 Tax=Streptomyces sp. S1A1-3 TaxID=2594458 RepID=UPI0011623B76|nr:hypothetical protein FNV58_47525 [Streptomyces sp. RLB1-9]QDO24322.1 hypothetical protein FNV65_46110 [Streptomyces sp. S1A1-8]QDO34444.1 hypothetical protein FNV63_46130 [Streptomyces sp. S1A1-3]
MAAPHTVGAAALLAAAHPGLTGAQLKDLLVSSSQLLGNTNVLQVGSGRVDVPAALSATDAAGNAVTRTAVLLADPTHKLTVPSRTPRAIPHGGSPICSSPAWTRR